MSSCVGLVSLRIRSRAEVVPDTCMLTNLYRPIKTDQISVWGLLSTAITFFQQEQKDKVLWVSSVEGAFSALGLEHGNLHHQKIRNEYKK